MMDEFKYRGDAPCSQRKKEKARENIMYRKARLKLLFPEGIIRVWRCVRGMCYFSIYFRLIIIHFVCTARM
jgi:hypothetical protein